MIICTSEHVTLGPPFPNHDVFSPKNKEKDSYTQYTPSAADLQLLIAPQNGKETQKPEKKKD
jgi:hypothetical protein